MRKITYCISHSPSSHYERVVLFIGLTLLYLSVCLVVGLPVCLFISLLAYIFVYVYLTVCYTDSYAKYSFESNFDVLTKRSSPNLIKIIITHFHNIWTYKVFCHLLRPIYMFTLYYEHCNLQ